ncbi:uncharacterized protein [Pleurodeles waltl]|uniref:uncharacterized protein isoform X1 n=1 Tax=Pleurodeles waltl TaxID=8319 RepID=UPI003709A7B0
MSAFLIRSCILLAFITAGHSLICEVCSSRNATMCNGKMMTCDANMDTCEHSIVRSNAFPARKDKPNSVSCPSCFHVGSYECEPVKMLQCTDSETSCISFKGIMDPFGNQPLKKLSLDCVNLKDCDPFPELPGGLIMEIEDVSCTKG